MCNYINHKGTFICALTWRGIVKDIAYIVSRSQYLAVSGFTRKQDLIATPRGACHLNKCKSGTTPQQPISAAGNEPGSPVKSGMLTTTPQQCCNIFKNILFLVYKLVTKWYKWSAFSAKPIRFFPISSSKSFGNFEKIDNWA